MDASTALVFTAPTTIAPHARRPVPYAPIDTALRQFLHDRPGRIRFPDADDAAEATWCARTCPSRAAAG